MSALLKIILFLLVRDYNEGRDIRISQKKNTPSLGASII